LKTFGASSLSNLENGSGMFSWSALTAFTLDLPKLKKGNYMFAGTAITSFTAAMPELETAANMFGNCAKLTSATLSSPKLKYA
jgi:hypothetical protein